MKRIILFFRKNAAEEEWDTIEKGMNHKYIKRIPTGNVARPWYYIYAETFLKPFKALTEFFGVKEKRITETYSSENIKKDYGVDKKTWASHILEYFTNKEKWNKIFSSKETRDKNKKPVQQKKVIEKIEQKEKKKVDPKRRIINRSLMRKVWSIFSPDGKQIEQKEKDEKLLASGGNGGGGDDGNGGKVLPKMNYSKSKEELQNELNSKIVAEVKSGTIKATNDKKAVVVAKEWVENNIKMPAKTVIGEVIINKSTIKDSLAHGFGQNKLDVIPAIESVLENGTYIGYSKDKNGATLTNHFFAGKVKIDDNEKIVFCRVHSAAGDNSNRFYVHEVFTEDEIKKERTLQTSPAFYGWDTGRSLYMSILYDILEETSNENSFEAHENRSQAMMGNQNARKPFTKDDFSSDTKSAIQAEIELGNMNKRYINTYIQVQEERAKKECDRIGLEKFKEILIALSKRIGNHEANTREMMAYDIYKKEFDYRWDMEHNNTIGEENGRENQHNIEQGRISERNTGVWNSSRASSDTDVNRNGRDSNGIENLLSTSEYGERLSTRESDERLQRGRGLLGRRLTKGEIKNIRKQVVDLLASKKDNEFTDEDKALLRLYEGAGGLGEENASNAGVLNEYYTPISVVNKVWELVDKYNPRQDKKVIEPSAGTGRFAEGRSENFTMFELDETSSRINRILHPNAKVHTGYFQENFMNGGIFSDKDFEKYDVAIGNPPYGRYEGLHKGRGEGKEHSKIDEYFIDRSLDTLKDGGILAMVVPSGFLKSKNSKVKEKLEKKGKLLEAWRLPNGTFSTTGVGTDIIVIQKGKGEKGSLSNDDYFLKNPNCIVGTETERTGRFGKLEKYVALNNGETFDDAIERIKTDAIKVNNFEIPETSTQLNEITEYKEPYITVDHTTGRITKTDKNGKTTVIEEGKNELEEHQNRSQAMLGNKNAYKGIIQETRDFSENEKAIAEDLVENNLAEPLTVEYTRENYDKLFKSGFVKTPIGQIKLSPHQFERLADKDNGTRKNYLGMLYQTLTDPLVIFDDKDKKGRIAKLFVKSFKTDDGKTCYMSIVPTIDGMNIVVSNGKRKVSGVLNKIKMASTLHYIAVGTSRTTGTVSNFSNVAQRLDGEPVATSNITENSISVNNNKRSIAMLGNQNAKKLFNIIDEYKNNLSTIEKKFVEDMKKDCISTNNIIKNKKTGKEYIGNYYVYPERKLTDSEKYIATILSSMGAEVYLINEPSNGGKKVDAIVNGIPVDFKDIGLGNNAIKNNYQNGMDKEHCNGIIMRVDDDISYIVKDKNGKKIKMSLDNAVNSWTKTKNNGILAIWIDNLDEFKTFDMKKIRADNESRLLAGHPAEPKQPISNDNTNIENVKNNKRSIAMLGNQNAAGEHNVQNIVGQIMDSEQFNKKYNLNIPKEEIEIWKATDVDGYINMSSLDNNLKKYIQGNDNYVIDNQGNYQHIANWQSGNIVEKLEELEKNYPDKSDKNYLYKKQLLEDVLPTPKTIDRLDLSPIEEWTRNYKVTINDTEMTLIDAFFQWAYNGNGYFDRNDSPITPYEIPSQISWNDIKDYINKTAVKAERVGKYASQDEKNYAQKVAQKTRDLRRQTAEKIFNRFLKDGLDKENADKLCKDWNRIYNSQVNPDYKKIPINVDGMCTHKGSKEFTLLEQQLKGVSFLANKGSGLLAYDVGVGKTVTGITATVKQLQSGRCKKPLICVPKAVYKQWIDEIHAHFPDQKIIELGNLGKQYFNQGDTIPDGAITICTYQALEKIGFKDETIKELYSDAESQAINPYGKKKEDKTQKQREEDKNKVGTLVGEMTKTKGDNTFFIEDLGFDHITIDEVHNFKNIFSLPRNYKLGKDEDDDSRQANEFSKIRGTSSERGKKMFALTQYIQKNNSNRNVYALSATPFTNSPTEIYSMLSLLARKRLHELGIYSLHEFLAKYIELKTEYVIQPDNSVKEEQVVKSFRKLDSLQKLLTEYIDKVDGDEAGVIRPHKVTHTPELELTPLQKQLIQEQIDYMQNANKKEDSAATLVAMNNMRMITLAPALVEPSLLDQFVESSPKLKFVCDSVIEQWKTNPKNGQVIYMPRGVEHFDKIVDYLVKHGMPKDAIGTMASSASTEKKLDERMELNKDFNDENGKCKVLIGSGTIQEGVSLNGNATTIYNCMLGWNPSETTQVEGRIWRQGNKQGVTHVVYPLMNDSIDALMYQKYDEKQSRIDELWKYKGDTLNVSDIDPEELKFALIKDPEKRADMQIAQEKEKLDNDVRQLGMQIDILEKNLKNAFETDVETALSSNYSYNSSKKDLDEKSNFMQNMKYFKQNVENAEKLKKKLSKMKDDEPFTSEDAEKVGIDKWTFNRYKGYGADENVKNAKSAIEDFIKYYDGAYKNAKQEKVAKERLIRNEEKRVNDLIESARLTLKRQNIESSAACQAKIDSLTQEHIAKQQELENMDKKKEEYKQKAIENIRKNQKQLLSLDEMIKQNVKTITSQLRPMDEIKSIIQENREKGISDKDTKKQIDEMLGIKKSCWCYFTINKKTGETHFFIRKSAYDAYYNSKKR